MFNVVLPKVPVRDLGACLEKGEAFFGPHALPWRLVLRREVAKQLVEELAAAGLREVAREPVMVLAKLPELPPRPDGLEIREVVGDEDLEHFRSTAFLGFGLPAQLGAKFVTPHFAERTGVRPLAGFEAGRPVCTSSLVMTGDQIGIYWVTTREDCRGRGLGEAITWAAIATGRALGGTWASLQASELGRPVYERMGFETPTENVKFERPKAA
jgi:GNAT superfamily N-acetyltransferase